ncbi:MAG: hypothetical protein F6K30_02565 [Cyanothece sp. SIO2G6]|nr:hypothetical protein [Cyanothece sp. SIO2G6]
MDSDSQSDKPPQENFSEFTNLLGMVIAFITLVTPIISIILFSTPSAQHEPLASSTGARQDFNSLFEVVNNQHEQ